jgi:hypothetical protein
MFYEKEEVMMRRLKINFFLHGFSFSVLMAGFTLMTACAPLNPAPRPTLDEVRSGTSHGPTIDDSRLGPGEVQAEVVEVDRTNRKIRVVTDRGRRRTLPVELNRTQVTYHGWEYAGDNLEAGDLIAYERAPRNGYVESIRIVEPVQARTAASVVRNAPAVPRRNVVEGTVERIEPDLGVFDIRPRTGRSVTASIPYNARTADIESFRDLRRGDFVRVEGEFVSPDNFQLVSFLSPRGR